MTAQEEAGAAHIMGNSRQVWDQYYDLELARNEVDAAVRANALRHAPGYPAAGREKRREEPREAAETEAAAGRERRREEQREAAEMEAALEASRAETQRRLAAVAKAELAAAARVAKARVAAAMEEEARIAAAVKAAEEEAEADAARVAETAAARALAEEVLEEAAAAAARRVADAEEAHAAKEKAAAEKAAAAAVVRTETEPAAAPLASNARVVWRGEVGAFARADGSISGAIARRHAVNTRPGAAEPVHVAVAKARVAVAGGGSGLSREAPLPLLTSDSEDEEEMDVVYGGTRRPALIVLSDSEEENASGFSDAPSPIGVADGGGGGGDGACVIDLTYDTDTDTDTDAAIAVPMEDVEVAVTARCPSRLSPSARPPPPSVHAFLDVASRDEDGFGAFRSSFADDGDDGGGGADGDHLEAVDDLDAPTSDDDDDEEEVDVEDTWYSLAEAVEDEQGADAAEGKTPLQRPAAAAVAAGGSDYACGSGTHQPPEQWLKRPGLEAAAAAAEALLHLPTAHDGGGAEATVARDGGGGGGGGGFTYTPCKQPASFSYSPHAPFLSDEQVDVVLQEHSIAELRRYVALMYGRPVTSGKVEWLRRAATGKATPRRRFKTTDRDQSSGSSGSDRLVPSG